MRVYLLVGVLFFHLSVFGQDSTGIKNFTANEKKNEVYYTVLLGYGFGVGPGQNNQVLQSSNSNRITTKPFSYGKGFNISFAGGILFSSNLGIELNLGYHYGGKNKINNGYWIDDNSSVRYIDQWVSYSAKYILINPNMVLTTKNKRGVKPYLKVGPVMALGGGLSEYENKLTFKNGYQGTEKFDWAWKGGFGLGVNSSIGVKIKTKNEKVFWVLEATYTSLGLSFKEGERINNSYKDVQLTSPLTESQTKIVFVDKVDEKVQNPNKPLRQLKHKANSNSLAIAIGFYIII
ncbi:hypothetical protein [Sporocytophaga myxococcoides]|uniref:hypothetical protein n=1 Tax=Sporocytophaga myxococcoides TaxID=153721 RepID=UPI00040101FF|nr:hypothetical protein [Sporocytophaga myxococcoides]